MILGNPTDADRKDSFMKDPTEQQIEFLYDLANLIDNEVLELKRKADQRRFDWIWFLLINVAVIIFVLIRTS